MKYISDGEWSDGEYVWYFQKLKIRFFLCSHILP